MIKENNEEFIGYLKKYSLIWSLLLDTVSKDVGLLNDYYTEEDEKNLKKYIKKYRKIFMMKK